MNTFSLKFALCFVACIFFSFSPSIAGHTPPSDAIDRLSTHKTDHGVAPTIDDFFKEVESSLLTIREQIELFKRLKEEQTPSIEMETLLTTLTDTQNRIRSFSCRYRYRDHKGETEYEYAYNQDGFYLKTIGSATQVENTWTFDGKHQRSIFDQPSNPRNGVIDTIFSRGQFTTHSMPLFQAMLFNSDLLEGISETVDLPRYLKNRDYFFIHERLEDIDGDKCLRLSNYGMDIYLDVAKNYALRRLDSFETEETHVKDKMTIKRILDSQRVNSDFVDFGNGIWVPKKIKVTIYKPVDFFNLTDNKPTPLPGIQTYETTVLEMQVNPRIEKTKFTDIFPEGTLILDARPKEERTR